MKRPNPRDHDYELTRRALLLIEQQLRERRGAALRESLRTATLAADLTTTPVQLKRSFVRVRRIALAEYVHGRLVTEGAKLLVFTAMPVSEIAVRVGMTHFTAAFTEAIGVAPVQFRRMVRV